MTKMFGAALAAAALAGTAMAGEPATILFSITAVNSNGTATFNVTDRNVTVGPNGAIDWNLDNGIQLMDNAGNLIASIEDLGFGQTYANGPSTDVPRGPGFFQSANLALSFAVTAGALDTAFFISASQALPATFVVPLYEASAGLTLTDNDGIGGSATATANGPNGAFFYNYGFNGGDFGALIGSPAGTGTTVALADGVGLTAVGFSVNSLFANYSFLLSARDSASGTSILSIGDIVPAPSSLALIGVGGLVAARRRR